MRPTELHFRIREGITMTTCKVTDCNSTELVYSGVDALIMGVPTETICFEHARNYALVLEALNV